MLDQILEVKTRLGVSKSPHEVFEAIVDPAKMSCYFISGGTGRLDAGEAVTWEWADVGGQLTVTPQKVERDRSVSFLWSASGVEARVVIELEPVSAAVTLVTVTESGWPPDVKGIARCVEQTQGWMHMLCCMKAYLEHGINLRKGGVVKRSSG